MAQKRIELNIHGMHCASCEILIESKFKQIPGVRHASVKYAKGQATVFCEREPALQEFRQVVEMDGYRVTREGVGEVVTGIKNSKRDYLEIGATLAVIFGLYLIFKETKILDIGFTMNANMSYGLIFLVGLVAASSTCIAVSGGVLLSVAAKYNETYQPETKFQKFIPHLSFNIGRILSYTVLGGVIGALGSALSFSPKGIGIITLVAAVFMILMGLRILNIFPWLNRIGLYMPKFIGRRVLSLEGKKGKAIPFIAGALSFFLPCGFTQTFQLYAISRGNFMEGALIMLFFSLGTLPALLSLGALSSFAKGNFGRLFLKFSGTLVLVLGFYNISNALALTGNPINLSGIVSIFSSTTSSSAVRLVNGKQVVAMDVTSRGYEPNQFTVQQGVPVRWEINGINAYGCQSVIVVPSYNIVKYVEPGKNIIEFTPQQAGNIPFSCTMGMYRGNFTVLPDADACDPTITNCL